VIEVNDLVVRYPGAPRPAVDGISFSVPAGSVVALLGPNGAGKTSTVETLEGYIRPTSGRVQVLGMDPVNDARSLAPRVGVMLQKNGVYLSMGPAQILRLFAAYYGSRSESPEKMLDLVGLRNVARTPWRRLSGGEQQRLSLGLALIGRPDVAFLDEPTAGMDPSARQTLWSVIESLRSNGATVVLTTHYLEEAERLADQVVILDKGSIIASGSPEELRHGTHADIRFSAPPGLDVSSLGASIGANAREVTTGEYLVEAEPTPRVIAAVASWLADRDVVLGDLRGSRQRLEDVFLRLTGESERPPETEAIQPARSRKQRGRTNR
jgi:ABC-2 type transport system ATP-binding protein